MAAVEYKDFQLSPRPYQFRDTGDWLASVIIAKQPASRDQKREKRFFSNKVFNEKQEADRHSIQFGKEVIDGRHANLSVCNL